MTAKNCPFCGASASTQFDPDGQQYVICDHEFDCPMQVQGYTDPALPDWNRRVADPETVRLRYQRDAQTPDPVLGEAAALIRSLTVIKIDPETRARAVAWLSAYAEEVLP